MTNIVLLVGNVGADPITRSTQGGTTIATVSIATSRRYKTSAGEAKEETEWHRVTCFNGTARAVAQYVRKGSKLSVQGRLHYTKWTGQDGVDRYGCEIYADEVNFLSRPKDDAGEPATTDAQADDIDDQVPF